MMREKKKNLLNDDGKCVWVDFRRRSHRFFFEWINTVVSADFMTHDINKFLFPPVILLGWNCAPFDFLPISIQQKPSTKTQKYECPV